MLLSAVRAESAAFAVRAMRAVGVWHVPVRRTGLARGRARLVGKFAFRARKTLDGAGPAAVEPGRAFIAGLCFSCVCRNRVLARWTRCFLFFALRFSLPAVPSRGAL